MAQRSSRRRRRWGRIRVEVLVGEHDEDGLVIDWARADRPGVGSLCTFGGTARRRARGTLDAWFGCITDRAGGESGGRGDARSTEPRGPPTGRPARRGLVPSPSTTGMNSPGWVDGATEAVQEWLKVYPGRARAGGWTSLGEARSPDDPQWLVLDQRGQRRSADSIASPCLAGRLGPEQSTSYPVEEFRLADGVLRLRLPAAVPPSSRWVWVQSMSPRFLLESLLSGLRSAGPAPLAEALAQGRFAGRPDADVAVPPGLLAAQADAYRACRSPGVRLVWGPPGAGKTRVLARAIEDLVRGGRRVLLVSTANVAVDNAVRAVVTSLQPARGTVVRVGPAHLVDIAANPDVQLDLLAAGASRAADEARARTAAQLAGLVEADSEAERLGERLADFDDAAYRVAAERVANADRLADLESEQEITHRAVDAARARVEQARRVLGATDVELAGISGPRAALNRMAELEDELRHLDDDERGLRLELATAEELAVGGLTGWRHRRRVREAEAALSALTASSATRRGRLWQLITENRALAGDLTPDEITRLDARRVGRAKEALTAERAFRESEALARDTSSQRERLRRAGIADATDRELVHRCERAGLLEDHRRWVELRAGAEDRDRQRGRLEADHRRLVDRARALRADAEGQLIREARVVATTLARSRVHRAVAAASFDVVLVDEAGAATLAEVLLALCRATTTAVLFGDFLQLGAVLDGKIEQSDDPAVVRWVQGSCFTRAGIRTAAAATRHDSCIPLLHQFRFGAGLRQLANDVIYEVLRDAAELGVRANSDTDIVLVDVSSLGDLATIQPGRTGGRWWAAGLVLSRALAQTHLPEAAGRPGESVVGIVTPYRAQVEATLAALRDQDIVAGVACGTVHGFQGREFDNVVFDLVDDGSGWVGRSRPDRGNRENSGVRLFGVGITRARSRLYLLVDGRAVRSAVHRGPLQALRAAMERGDVRTWSAAALLGVDPAPAEAVDPAFDDVAAVLRQLVAVTDVTDEITFGDELRRHLVSARESIWMWSPWISTRAEVVVPLITDAVGRGVEVWVFIRPDEERNMRRDWAQRQMPALLASGATVIRSDQEHRKIVVVDRRTVLFGSLNVLSQNPDRSRESMLTLDGRAFADRLMTELDADNLGRPRPCPTCRRVMELRRGTGRGKPLRWHCRPCGTRIDVQPGA